MKRILLVLAVLIIFPVKLHAFPERPGSNANMILQDDFRDDTDLWSLNGNAFRDIENEALAFAKRTGSEKGEAWLNGEICPPFTLEFRYFSEAGAQENCPVLLFNGIIGVDDSNVIRTNAWHSVSITVEEDSIEGYLDGKMAAVQGGRTGAAPGRLGFQAPTAYYNKTCMIDDVRITLLNGPARAASMFIGRGLDVAKRKLEFPYRNIYEERDFQDKIELYGAADKIPVLMYHHILMSEDKKRKNSLIVTTEEFEEQMRYLFENGYTTITTKELELFLEDKIELPERSVLITFDDGYQSNYVYAYPILKRYGFKAGISLIPALMPENAEKLVPWKMSYMSWPEAILASDVFEYMNHTYSHVSMKQISYGRALEEISRVDEVLNSKCFVYPIGHTSSNSERVLRELNYELAFTTRGGFVSKSANPLHLNRQRVNPGITLQEFISLLK